MSGDLRVIAIDWSGAAAKSGQRKHIWIAEIRGGRVQLSSGKTRQQVAEWLLVEIGQSAMPTVVGLDFAFSFPESFFRRTGLASVGDLWRDAAENGERWLRACEPPFWGRPGKRCPATHREQGYRQTDNSFSVNGIAPKSVFQIGGAGAVGTGSIRGMPMLASLRAAGFSIWPFDAPAPLMALEIYPRLLTGPVHKSSAPGRKAYLDTPEFKGLPADARTAALGSEDAFDALISAIRMYSHRETLLQLKQTHDPVERLEGKIWSPGLTPSEASGAGHSGLLRPASRTL